jgi:hypothetical protein
VFKRFGHALLILALLGAMGAHWTVLQTIAWTTMLADNLQTASFSEAVTKTFAGNHPCGLCHNIKKGKKAEKSTEFSLTLKKLEFVSVRPAFIFSAPQRFDFIPQLQTSFATVLVEPPVPPPRGFLA